MWRLIARCYFFSRIKFIDAENVNNSFGVLTNCCDACLRSTQHIYHPASFAIQGEYNKDERRDAFQEEAWEIWGRSSP